jgi:hypothetical protein
MTNFAPVDTDSATGNAAELLAQVQKSVGQTPNMTKVMANSPALLKSYLVLSGAVAGGTLPAAVRERLAIATAQLKVDRAELNNARKGQSNDPHVAALLKLSNDIAENAGDLDDTEAEFAQAESTQRIRAGRHGAQPKSKPTG